MSIIVIPPDPPRTVEAPALGPAAGGWIASVLFGGAPERRGPITLTLLAMLVYLLFALVVACEVFLGLMDGASGLAWSLASIAGILGFYLLIRTGLSERLGGDPSLTLYQSAFGVAATAFGYAINPELRGAIIAIMMLNLVWGMFVLKDRQALGLCMFALALLAATMAWKSATDPARYPPHIEMLHFSFALILLVATSVLSMRMGGLRARLAARKAELQQALATIRELAQVDELTRLGNRRHVLEMLAIAHARCVRSGETLSVVMIDLDHFKAINDRHGHAMGDAVLREFAQVLRAGLRESDFAGRWGGEEFLLVLPQMRAEAAATLVDRLREAAGRLLFDPALPGLKISFSAGAAECAASEPTQVAIERADQAMYRAKEAGRGRTVVHGRAPG
jgi:diguanylate cyclase (GGDEF)-like protein